MAPTSRLSVLSDEVTALADLPDGPSVVALSGGPDSAVCAWVALRGDFPVRAVHVDHGFPDSPVLRHAAEGIAESLGIKIDTVEVIVGTGASPENEARIARYQALESSLEPGEELLTGHTRTDQAETVLGNLLRGAGLDGLTGIPTRRGSIVRPLLKVTRSQTRELATLLGLPWIEDPANLQEGPRRNLLRNDVMPDLERVSPSLEEILARTARVLSSDRDVLDQAADRVPWNARKGVATLPATLLSTLPSSIASRAIRAALRAVSGPYAGDFRDVQLVLSVASGGIAEATLPGGVSVRRDRALVVVDACEDRPVPDAEEWTVPGRIRFGDWAFEATMAASAPTAFPPSRYVEVFDADEFPSMVAVRTPSDADRVVFSEGHKSVRQVLAEAGIPPWRRNRWPIMATGEQVIWVPGVRRASVGWIDTTTTRYLWVRATREDV